MMRVTGIVFKPLLDSGYINWNHSHEAGHFIGEPTEAYVTHPGPQKAPVLFMKGFLYGSQEERLARGYSTKADDAWDQLQLMEQAVAEGHGRRRMGWSVEGGVLLRGGPDGKILDKSVVRYMAMTPEPVNSDTWARVVLAKSLGYEVDDGVLLDVSDEQVPHFVFGNFDALVKSLVAGEPGHGVAGTPEGPALLDAPGGAESLRLEQLSPAIVSVLPRLSLAEALQKALYTPCVPGRRCHDGRRFLHGRLGLLEHLIACAGNDHLEAADAVGGLYRDLVEPRL